MLYQLMRRVLSPLARLIFRPRIEGLDNVPQNGAVILASNHLSFVDSLVIPLIVPRKVAFLAKAEYFHGKGVKGAIARWFFTMIGQIPVERGRGRAAKDALDVAIKVLAGGGAFGIYPEGTRSEDGRLYRGKTGVGRIALASGASVVPVALIGTERIQPIGKKMPRPYRVTVRFGEPLDFSRYEGMSHSTVIHRTVTDEIMYAILELSGQEYVDTYHQRKAA
ncbi:1-acyl-sn-glycerol-3-phosphate acyltransferase [Allokutzneria sp. A3M-2-11 16]|uniref:lysophospholipid acyltransferase family protein n=1 Tax=Allokutzneria sp. A3M-2-11 16 TaxID=2962043 RepID=UPI0020B6541D|nr:lysophospholipid acyltransferase family protein [Allokutzneria sp. A3M-2-11 16]MCP3802332.1 1-acyl-sn-glycerol-3-phosphate acyltransferase [Allokutzneria sp. A3M-2-11 16]